MANGFHESAMRRATAPFPSGPASSATVRRTLPWLGLMVLLWGISWPATKLALEVVPPLWLATIRFGSAALCLFAFTIARGSFRIPTRADWPIVASIGLFQMTAFTGLGMIAMTKVDTSRAVLLAYTTPLWGVVANWLIFQLKPSRRQIGALAVGLAGVALICSPWELDWNAPGVLVGSGLLLVAAMSWSVVILHIKRHRWDSSPLTLAPWQMLLAVVPLGGLAWCFEGPPTGIPVDARLLELLLFIGPVATSACFVISAEYGRRISTFAMSNLTLGVPLIGILASVVFLGSSISAPFAAGLVLVMGGMAVSALASKRH